MSEANPTLPGRADVVARSYDSRLPPSLAEKQMKVSDFSRITASAMASELDNSVRLLRGHCYTLQLCSERIEGSLLTLGVPTTHDLLSSIASVVEGLDATASSCKRMCDSHNEEVRQREDLFASLATAYASLKDRHEATELELRQVISVRDRERASFDRVVEYVEAVIAERAAWQAQYGLNAANIPLVEPTFAQRCRETLAVCGSISRETNKPECCAADNAAAIVARWESAEAARQCTVAPAVRLAFVPPLAEVQLLREVLAMGTGSRTLLHDVREERRGLEESKKRARELTAAAITALRRTKLELARLREWFVSLERRGQPFLASAEGFRIAVRGEMQRQQQFLQAQAQADEALSESTQSMQPEQGERGEEERMPDILPSEAL